MTRAFIFPGQGSQAVGMGLALSESFGAARLVFEEVDEALKQKLSKLIFEGPESDLTLTENAQPALMAVSIAALRVLESEGGWRLADKASYVAGHSLGEYSALAAAGALDLSDAARLLKLRGQAMQKAVPVGEGAMAALLGPDLEQVQKIAKQAADDTKLICGVANDNSPGQVVVSGAKAAVERAIAIAAEQGVKRSVMLPVSAPFHCALMQPAADAMEEALAKAAIRQPAVPVVANVTAQPTSDAATIAKLLVSQVTATVRWRESILTMKSLGVAKTYELGAGKVLAGLVKRIDKEIEASSVGAPADVETALKALS
ncbi:ACP S-malonyltransferase [Dongia deserti]|uniref:ACP S-malonyltransferase n=1 Tax=Dongia deserti TaxID=2268030 RepID=UPI000E64E288|nr:ACP S-malonyltransferase [Dongia deserti]